MVLDLLKKHRKIVFYILFTIAVLLLVYKCGRDTADREIQYKEKIVYKDSIKEVEKVSKEIEQRLKIQSETIEKLKKEIKKAKGKTIEVPTICEPIVKFKDSIINKQDTLIIYQDSLIKGKDSIIYLDRKVIEYQDKIINIAPKPKRWGIGLQGGYGANKDGLSPFIGVGVSYDIISF